MNVAEVQTPLLIAHGGDPTRHPENSIQGADSAANIYKADVVEVDAVAKNGALRCHHPSTPSNSNGQYCSAELTHVSGPLLIELISKVTPTPVLIDLKSEGKETLEALSKLFTARGTRNIIVGVRTLDDAKKLKELWPELMLLALFSDPDSFLEFKALGGILFRLWEKDVTAQRVQAIHECGMEVWVTPGQKSGPGQPRTAGECTPKKLLELQALGVGGVLVNDIDLAKKTLKDAQLL